MIPLIERKGAVRLNYTDFEFDYMVADAFALSRRGKDRGGIGTETFGMSNINCIQQCVYGLQTSFTECQLKKIAFE